MAITLKRKGGQTPSDVITRLLCIRNQLKLYHWQTKSFARHKASDDIVTSLDGHIDTFVETYMGKYSRPSVSGQIVLHNWSEAKAKKFLESQRHFLSHILPKMISSEDTDLLNIRDEILGDINKTDYLFTLA